MAALGLGFVGFVCRSIIRLPLLVRLLSLKFNLVFVVVVVVCLFFFFLAMGSIFGWMLIVVAVDLPWVWVCC